jgi:curved DNA-binding protein
MTPQPAVNYYDLFQINPRAELETIERVYRLLAARYHPDNQNTGDPDRFRILSEAYAVLRDAAKRKEYDRQFEIHQTEPLAIFLGKEFTEGIDSESKIRIGVLCLLYSKRRANPDYAALSLLALWYLRAKRLVLQDDRSSFIISAEGVDYLEGQLPTNQILYKIFRASENGVMVYPKALTSKTT